MAKDAYHDLNMARMWSGNPVCLHLQGPVFICQSKIILFTQRTPVKVEYSDKPEAGPLTILHLLSQLVLHIFLLALCTLVWIGELCVRAAQKRKNQATANINAIQHRSAWREHISEVAR